MTTRNNQRQNGTPARTMQAFINRHVSLQTDDWPEGAGIGTPVEFVPRCIPEIMGEDGLNEFYMLHSNYQQARELYRQFAYRFHTKTGPFTYQEISELDSLLRQINLGDVQGIFGMLQGHYHRHTPYSRISQSVREPFEQRIAEIVYNSGRPVFYDQVIRPVTREDRLSWQAEHSTRGLLEELCWMHYDVLEEFLRPLHEYLFYECAGYLQGEDLVLMPLSYMMQVAGKDNCPKEKRIRLGPMRDAVRQIVPREFNFGRIADNITWYTHKFVGGHTTGIFGRYRPVVEDRMDFRQRDVWLNCSLPTRAEYMVAHRGKASLL